MFNSTLPKFLNCSGQDGLTVNSSIPDGCSLIYMFRLDDGHKIGMVGVGVCEGKTPAEAFRARYSGSSERTLRDANAQHHPSFMIFNFEAARCQNDDMFLHSTAADDSLRNYLIKKELLKKGGKDKNTEFVYGLETNWEKIKKCLPEWAGVSRDFDSRDNLLPHRWQHEYMIDPVDRAFNQGCRNVCLSSFMGSGKSTIAPYFFAKYSKPGGVNLFTTPIIDTMNGVKISAAKYIFLGQRICLFTGDDVVSPDFKIRLKKVQDAGEIIVICISVQGLRNQTGNDEVGLSKKYAKILNKIKFDLWICDERHKEYNGVVTDKAFSWFKGNNVSKILDLTATPFNLISMECYRQVPIVNFSLLKALQLKKQGDENFQWLPDVEMYCIDVPLTSDTKYRELYQNPEGFDSRKQFDVKGNGFIYKNGLIDIAGKIFQSGVDNEVKFPHAIYAGLNNVIDNQHNGMLVIPCGDSEMGVGERGPKLVELLNSCVKGTTFVYADEIQSELSVSNAVRKIQDDSRKNVVIVTHRKLTTGTDIPQLEFIVLMDKITSINVFIQLIGRVMRAYEGKKTVRVFILQPGITVKSLHYDMLKNQSLLNGEIEISKELIDCMPLTIYDVMGKHQVSLEEMMHSFYEELEIFTDVARITTGFLKQFELDRIIKECGMKVDILKSGFSRYDLTDPNKAKTKKMTRIGVAVKDKETKIEGTRSILETVSLMISESFRIGLLSLSEDIREVFESEIAKDEFGENRCQFMLDLFDVAHDFYPVISTLYTQTMAIIRSLPYDEQCKMVMRNEHFKKHIGQVYVPFELCRIMLESIR